ncbi:MAG: O-antigen ligase family protein, partial [Acidobacteriota bacterium]|nr:O-antigen ligase family protein [Acidobacteriota bacterium]
MEMKKSGLFDFFAAISLVLLFYVVVIHLRFKFLPVFFLALGFISYVIRGRKALLLFLFLLPCINATPDLFFNGYPFNYMGIPLFYLSGIILASRFRKEKQLDAFPGTGPYLLFVSLLGISALFMFLRWSNLTLSLGAFLGDTPVAPSGERVSFACIFPVITLALFSLAPFLAFLLRRNGMKEAEIFNPLRAGFAVSFLMAMIQKWLAPGFLAQSWWGVEMKQVNGGFSDFNAFGFFAGAMFLYQALRLIDCLPRRSGDVLPVKAGGPGGFPCSSGLKKPLPDILFLVIALLAIFVSGCRTAFLFVLLAVLCLLFSKRTGFRAKALIVLLLAVSLFIAGGTLITRLKHTAAQAARITAVMDLQMAIDEVSSGRLDMLDAGGRMIRRFPLSGIGAGNFLFYLKYLHFGKNAYFDLPLNQYLLIFSEIGLIGGLAFLFFLWILFRRQKPGIVRLVLAAMAVALLFNNFFWFPEVLLLFWIFAARAEWPAAPPPKKWAAWAAAAILALFVFANITAFHDLNPATWANETSTPYDYGFFYPENEGGREFRWCGEKAGMYIFLDKDNPRAMVKLTCSAPLSRMAGKQQAVDVFWRGNLYRRILFHKNSDYSLPVEDVGHSGGFLEFRVHPSFNLKRMGLSAESRDLGVKVSGGAINHYIDVNEERREGQ